MASGAARLVAVDVCSGHVASCSRYLPLDRQGSVARS
jgi:hypothetical protein